MSIPIFTHYLNLFLLSVFTSQPLSQDVTQFFPHSPTQYLISIFGSATSSTKTLPDQYLFYFCPLISFLLPLISHLISVPLQKIAFSLFPFTSLWHQVTFVPTPAQSSLLSPFLCSRPLPHPFEFQCDDFFSCCLSCGMQGEESHLDCILSLDKCNPGGFIAFPFSLNFL